MLAYRFGFTGKEDQGQIRCQYGWDSVTCSIVELLMCCCGWSDEDL